MPLVRIDLVEGRSPEERRAIADAVHRAMTETIGVPADDRFQVVTQHPAGDLIVDPGYLGIARDEGAVIVQLTMKGGRTDAQKGALYRRIAELLAEEADVPPGNVLVVLTENDPIDWSFGDGAAQLAEDRGDG